ncbi:hypothetical protein FXO38_29047 [Capsicum annuum]|uniref:Leucine-rich repeat-containing N-terminal plant-type domain-containing protein n=1 Tax=Capsicum annuum TaxID=4072 RepID=A0A2G2Y7A4_CAPAN|nr:hypothetical protein FXO37_36022 [Capsicum annuum]KAF3626812.1 hypothetical protein FXO38_29047 [Capsicum annuum]PHT65637.1 hypothetical protein T459_30062 [Capsicum annuum]
MKKTYKATLSPFMHVRLTSLDSHNGNETDIQALLAIKEGITQDPYDIFTSWNDSVNICRWAGVTCGQLQQRVTKLNLTSLDLVANNLEGIIPSCVGQLKTLNFLGLGINKLNGALYGTLSSEFGFSLPKLELNLMQNGSNTGKVSIDFEGLSDLWYLILASDSIGTGEVDDLSFFNSLNSRRHLKVHDLSDCKFGGELPDSIANLSTTLLLLRLGVEIGALNNLGRSDISNNMLSGKIPGSIGRCVTLVSLLLSGNFFEGIIPSSLSSLSGLEDFEDQLPTAGVFRNASVISISGNKKLCGGIPELVLPICPNTELREKISPAALSE